MKRIAAFSTLLLIAVGFCGGRARAQCGSLGSPSTTWNDGNNGAWTTAGNWTSGAPNSSTNACIIDTTNTVILTGSGNVGSLQLASGNGLVVSNGSNLTVAGSSVLNAGSITMGSTGSFTDLVINTGGGILTLSGGGTLSLSNNPNNRVYSTGAGTDTLINDVSHTIQGSGQFGINNSGFGFKLTNKGIIDANQSTALQIAPSGLITNTGTLEATNGGTLALIGTFKNAGGTILGTGTSSVVELNGSEIDGGTLTTASGGTIQNSGTATVNGVTLSSGSTLTGVNGSATTLIGTITNNGIIAQNSTGGFTDLHISGPVTLTGTGSLTMSNSSNNRVFGINGGSDSLINDVKHTIQGSGQLGINNGGFAFTMTNNGTIDANQSAALQVAPSNTVINKGLLEATNGGTLDLIGTFNNAGGTILGTGASSVVELNGSEIDGGTLTTASGGTIQNNGTATVKDVTISSGSTLSLLDGTATTLMGTITNNGIIAQNSTGSFTDLHISGAVTLTGTGSLSMSDNFNNRVFASGSDSLINDVNHTIQGSGQLGINNGGFAFTLTNNGTINANQSNPLQIAPSNPVTNNSLLEATNGGTLDLIGTFKNAGGTILGTGASSVVELNGSEIDGGTLTTASGGTIQNSGTATVNAITLSGGSRLSLLNGTATTLMGTITNNGIIAQNSTGSFTDLHISGAVTLTGTGSLTMSDSVNNRVFASGSDTLLNDLNHTIQGSGQLGINNSGFAFTLTNNGTIDANQSAALQIAPSSTVINNGLLEATNGGTLLLTGGTFNNAGGTILGTGASSVVELNGSEVDGGTLSTASGGAIQNSGTATVKGITISTGSALSLLNGTATTLMGTITDNGTMAQNSTGSFTDLHISSPVTLTGTGSLTMSNSFNNRVFASGTDSLINDVNHTIQGSGQLGINNAGFAFTLTNNGTIIANQSNPLQIAPGTVINNGTIQTNSGSTMQVLSPFTQNAGKTQVDGTMSASSGELVSGGMVLGTGTINGNITLTGGAMQPGGATTPGTLTLNGNYNQTAGMFTDLINNSGNGLLFINGGESLGSGADLNILLSGFVPTAGEMFTIMDFNSGSGTFANAPTSGFLMDRFEWSAAYNSKDIVLTVESPAPSPAPTPEPGSMILLGSGLAMLGCHLRRKRALAKP